jgi:uncharacterized protein
MNPTQEELGIGVLLNDAHSADVARGDHAIDWLELIAEEQLGSQRGGFRIELARNIETLAADFPVCLHGVELSIGSVDPFDTRYLRALKSLIRILQPHLVTDHMCWTGAFRARFHELMPLPYEESVARYVAERIRYVQDYLGVQVCFENPPNYVTYRRSDMSEADFMTLVAEESDSLILLDVNNLHVSSTNNAYDPRRFLESLPADRVRQIHLAGNGRAADFLLDTHASPVSDEVWSLYERALELFGAVPTNIEWDVDVPSFAALDREVARAKTIRDRVAGNTAASPLRAAAAHQQRGPL